MILSTNSYQTKGEEMRKPAFKVTDEEGYDDHVREDRIERANQAIKEHQDNHFIFLELYYEQFNEYPVATPDFVRLVDFELTGEDIVDLVAELNQTGIINYDNGFGQPRFPYYGPGEGRD
jgi:hypothetical protein